jgi:ADP-heptose:LPS heptosyltransferase
MLHNPHVDEIFTLRSPAAGSLACLLPALRQRAISTVFLFHASQRPVLPFAAMLGASEIIGSEGINKGLDDLLTTRVPARKAHEIVRRLDLVERAGAYARHRSLELYLSEQDEELASSFLRKWAAPPYLPIVGLHPGAKDRFKQWAPEAFVEVGKRLQAHLGCRIIVTGNREEQELAARVATDIPGAASAAGALPVRALAALFKRMALVISNDTGPMHAACAVGVPTIALFGPTDPALCGPCDAPRAAALAKPPTCTPCVKKRCQDPFCMLQLSPAQVFETALRLYYGTTDAHRDHHP